MGSCKWVLFVSDVLEISFVSELSVVQRLVNLFVICFFIVVVTKTENLSLFSCACLWKTYLLLPFTPKSQFTIKFLNYGAWRKHSIEDWSKHENWPANFSHIIHMGQQSLASGSGQVLCRSWIELFKKASKPAEGLCQHLCVSWLRNLQRLDMQHMG